MKRTRGHEQEVMNVVEGARQSRRAECSVHDDELTNRQTQRHEAGPGQDGGRVRIDWRLGDVTQQCVYALMSGGRQRHLLRDGAKEVDGSSKQRVGVTTD